MWTGSMTALVTPFRGGAIDTKALETLIERQIDQGTSGLVLFGTTGESPTITHDEHGAIVKRCAAIIKSRVPLIVGTGANATQKTVDMTQSAKDNGADAALLVTPYYNRPTQEGLYLHYQTVADHVDLPLILYNVPKRTGCDLATETVARLAVHPRIVALKDASGEAGRAKQLINLLGSDFIQLCGEDAGTCDFLDDGGHGAISVTSNLVPGLCAQIHRAHQDGDRVTARALHEKLVPLHAAMFCESSPQPVKYALHRLGLIENELRLPLIPASDEARRKVDEMMDALGITAFEDIPPLQAIG